jgi:hypothetical protein
MEDDSFSVDAAKRSIDETGYVKLGCSSVGDRVAELEQSGFALWTEDGLEFCRRNVVFDAVSIRQSPKMMV